jgi:hypothetical protein
LKRLLTKDHVRHYPALHQQSGASIHCEQIRDDQLASTRDCGSRKWRHKLNLYALWRGLFSTPTWLAELDQVKCPVLLLSGTDDAEAPADFRNPTLRRKELRSVNQYLVR